MIVRIPLFNENKKLNEIIACMESRDDEEKTKLEGKIDELIATVKARDETILKLKRKSIVFQDDVFAAEESLEQKIKEQKIIITNLEKKLEQVELELIKEQKNTKEIGKKKLKLEKEINKLNKKLDILKITKIL